MECISYQIQIAPKLSFEMNIIYMDKNLHYIYLLFKLRSNKLLNNYLVTTSNFALILL